MSDASIYGSIRRYTAFHANRGCSALRVAKDVVSLDLDEVTTRPPCLICYPDFPTLRVLHATCQTCGHAKATPCPHNGGVLVLVPVPGRGDRLRRVWPEQAFRYKLAPVSTPV